MTSPEVVPKQAESRSWSITWLTTKFKARTGERKTRGWGGKNMIKKQNK